MGKNNNNLNIIREKLVLNKNARKLLKNEFSRHQVSIFRPFTIGDFELSSFEISVFQNFGIRNS